MRARARCATLVAAALAAGAARAEPEGLAFVHAEANVGGASGGHVALRLGEFAWHFQAEDDLLVLERDAWPAFRFRYGVLDNRPLHLAHLDLPAAELRRVGDGFAAFQLAQQRDFAALAAARADLAWLEALAGEPHAVVTRGAGLLDPSRPGDPAGAALYARVAARVGPGLVADALARAEAALGEPPLAPGAPRRLREAQAARAALLALRDAHALDAAARLAPEAGPALSADERAAQAALAAAQEDAVVDLVRSLRPDRGAALFTALARHRTASLSLAEDRLVLADPLPESAPALDARAVEVRRDELAALAAWLERDLGAARAALASAPDDERALQRLEEVAARHELLLHALRDGAPLPEPRGALLPQRGRALPVAAADVDRGALRAALSAARDALRTQERRIAADWRYDLFTANCATELVRTLIAALGGEVRAAEVLGGRLEPGVGLGFVPFALFDTVRERLAVREVERLPSWRERALAEPATADSALATAREATTWTSRVYRRRDADGSFLFFSDGTPLARPLQGVANLAYAGVDATLGIVTAPFDRGRRLARAARGALFSFPELVFVNIRKGSFDAAGLRRADGEAAAPR